MLTSGVVADVKLDDRSGSTANECLRLRAWRSSWPATPRFEARLPARGHRSEVRLVRRSAVEPAVRSMRVEPRRVEVDLGGERPMRERHEDGPGALALQRT